MTAGAASHDSEDSGGTGSAPKAGVEHRCGFVALVGRPNAGKSTLLNRIAGQHVSIVAATPQTTRTALRGVITRPGVQLVVVDTPGIHKPRNPLGRSLNAAASEAIREVDVTCLVIDAAAPVGRGDRFIAATLPRDSIVVVTKADRVRPATMMAQLAAAGSLDFQAYFPVSGRTGEGVETLVEYLAGRMPEGPALYEPGTVSDASEAFRVAELVREQLLRSARKELPHSIATCVTLWDWPLIRCEITVERPSQKAIVIGRGGSVLKEAGTAVRSRLPEGAYLELAVRVDRDWQRRGRAL